jgi:hypothetical protein
VFGGFHTDNGLELNEISQFIQTTKNKPVLIGNSAIYCHLCAKS